MKTTSLAWLVLLCAGSLAPPPSAAADANPALLGRWLTEAHDGKVGICFARKCSQRRRHDILPVRVVGNVDA